MADDFKALVAAQKETTRMLMTSEERAEADRLKEARMTATELLRILRADHFTLTVGQIIEGERALWLNASSRFKSLEDLKAIEGIEDNIAKKIYNYFHE